MALDRAAFPLRPAGVSAPPAPLGVWASWRAARRNMIELIPEPAFREPVLTGRGRGRGWMMLMDPAWLEQVLKTREPNYPKSPVTLRILRPREGRSLFTSEGPSWRTQRRAMAPGFQPGALRALAPAMSAAAEGAARRMAARAADEARIDVYPEMVVATCDVICDAALSGREALDRDALTVGVTRFISQAARLSLLDLLGAPAWIPRPARLLYRDGARMDRMIDGIVAARLAAGPSGAPDMLDLLLAGRDPETDDRLDPVDVRNNLIAFLTAGHETTALALTWALYLLALDGTAQRRAREEAQAALGAGAAGAEHLDRLGYVRQVIEEALRLYPPAALLSRVAREADEVAGHALLPGATVLIPVWALHRHRLLWDDPDEFDPDRFAPEAARRRHRYAYLPFSAGPKACIGLGFAMMEAQIILATLVARFEFTLPKGFAPEPRMWFTLRPGTGMPLEVKRL